jgi:hypothetical protein
MRAMMRLSINTATAFTLLLHNVHHLSTIHRNARSVFLKSKTMCATPSFLLDLSGLHHISASDFSAHLPVRTRPTSSRAVMPPPCPFALSSPRSCTTLRYLLVRVLAPPCTLVCVVRQPIFQVGARACKGIGGSFFAIRDLSEREND